jgi:hypothetical protein
LMMTGLRSGEHSAVRVPPATAVERSSVAIALNRRVRLHVMVGQPSVPTTPMAHSTSATTRRPGDW